MEYPFRFQMGGLRYDASYEDIPEVLRFKMASFFPLILMFFLDISLSIAHRVYIAVAIGRF